MLSVMINFGPLKKGGGQNVALNFLDCLFRKEHEDIEFHFVVCEKSTIYGVLNRSVYSDRLVVVSDNPLKRIFQELTVLKRYIATNDIKVLYSYFGYAFVGHDVLQVSGSADSNLYFPEVDFWEGEGLLGRLKRWLVDSYRVYGLKASDAVIFENEAMYKRAGYLFGIEEKTLILPSINISKEHDSVGFLPKKNKVTVLFFCGWQRNKNVLIIPKLVSFAKSKGISLEVVITATDDGSEVSKSFYDLVDKYSVHESINCIGTVTKSQIPDLYSKIDFVCLLSKLESFSNNIIESWYFRKPLIVADEEWSRAICGSAAVYVNRDSVSSIVSSIDRLNSDFDLYESYIDKGGLKLKSYPTVDERLNQEINYITGLKK